MKKRIGSALLGGLLMGAMALTMAACSSTPASTESSGTDSAGGATAAVVGTVTASGSSALLPLAEDAAEYFKQDNPDVSITLNAGGSGTGLRQVADGAVDIGNSDIAAEERLEADEAAQLVDHRVCVVTMAPIVNASLYEQGVTNLTKQQLQDIFTGVITNWSEVGGPDQNIVLITRPSTSGTRALFQEYALDGKEEITSSLETDDSGTLLQSVADNEGAIGYVALSYLVNNTSVAPVAVDGVEPTLENTYNGTYPVWGYEHMYTKGEPTGAVKAYLDFIQSEEYGARMEELGYGVTSKMTVSRE